MFSSSVRVLVEMTEIVLSPALATKALRVPGATDHSIRLATHLDGRLHRTCAGAEGDDAVRRCVARPDEAAASRGHPAAARGTFPNGGRRRDTGCKQQRDENAPPESPRLAVLRHNR